MLVFAGINMFGFNGAEKQISDIMKCTEMGRYRLVVTTLSFNYYSDTDIFFFILAGGTLKN